VLFCRVSCFCVLRVWRRLTPLLCDTGDAACMHLVEEKNSIKVHVVRCKMHIQWPCSITHQMPGVVAYSFPLSVRSCLYCTHGIGRIAAPLRPMGNEFLTRRAVPYLKRPRLPCISRCLSGGPLLSRHSRAELGTTPSSQNAHPKSFQTTSKARGIASKTLLDELG